MPYAEFEEINFMTIRGSNRYAPRIKTIVYMHMEAGFCGIAVLGRNSTRSSMEPSIGTTQHKTPLVVLLFFNCSVIPAPVSAESFSLFRQARRPAIILVDPAIRDMKYPNTEWPLRPKIT